MEQIISLPNRTTREEQEVTEMMSERMERPKRHDGAEGKELDKKSRKIRIQWRLRTYKEIREQQV